MSARRMQDATAVRRITLIAGLILVMLCGALPASRAAAAALRDPTVAPVVPGSTPSASSGAAAGRIDGLDPEALSIIVRHGCRYLLWDAETYAEGEKIGNVRIERIDETEIWLRDASALHRLPVYAGVVRREERSATPASAMRPSRQPTRESTRQTVNRSNPTCPGKSAP